MPKTLYEVYIFCYHKDELEIRLTTDKRHYPRGTLHVENALNEDKKIQSQIATEGKTGMIVRVQYIKENNKKELSEEEIKELADTEADRLLLGAIEIIQTLRKEIKNGTR